MSYRSTKYKAYFITVIISIINIAILLYTRNLVGQIAGFWVTEGTVLAVLATILFLGLKLPIFNIESCSEYLIDVEKEDIEGRELEEGIGCKRLLGKGYQVKEKEENRVLLEKSGIGPDIEIRQIEKTDTMEKLVLDIPGKINEIIEERIQSENGKSRLITTETTQSRVSPIHTLLSIIDFKNQVEKNREQIEKEIGKVEETDFNITAGLKKLGEE